MAENAGGDKLVYFLIGAGIGAVTALLFAPKAGAELRADIADRTRRRRSARSSQFFGSCNRPDSPRDRHLERRNFSPSTRSIAHVECAFVSQPSLEPLNFLLDQFALTRLSRRQ